MVVFFVARYKSVSDPLSDETDQEKPKLPEPEKSRKSSFQPLSAVVKLVSSVPAPQSESECCI